MVIAMEILIYMAAIVAALAILGWTLDLDNEEEENLPPVEALYSVEDASQRHKKWKRQQRLKKYGPTTPSMKAPSIEEANKILKREQQGWNRGGINE
jgi:hypothetical protein